jgi:hypothetical protein
MLLLLLQFQVEAEGVLDGIVFQPDLTPLILFLQTTCDGAKGYICASQGRLGISFRRRMYLRREKQRHTVVADEDSADEVAHVGAAVNGDEVKNAGVRAPPRGVCEPVEDLDAQGLGRTGHGHGAGEEGTFEDVDRVEVEPDLDLDGGDQQVGGGD